MHMLLSCAFLDVGCSQTSKSGLMEGQKSKGCWTNTSTELQVSIGEIGLKIQPHEG